MREKSSAGRWRENSRAAFKCFCLFSLLGESISHQRPPGALQSATQDEQIVLIPLYHHPLGFFCMVTLWLILIIGRESILTAKHNLVGTGHLCEYKENAVLF